MATFSTANPVRAAVRVQDGRIVAQPFADDGRPTESAVEFGDVRGVDLGDVFERVRFVFSVPEVSG